MASCRVARINKLSIVHRERDRERERERDAHKQTEKFWQLKFFEFVTANPKRARLFHNKAFANEDIYRPFLKSVPYLPVLDPLNK